MQLCSCKLRMHEVHHQRETSHAVHLWDIYEDLLARQVWVDEVLEVLCRPARHPETLYALDPLVELAVVVEFVSLVGLAELVECVAVAAPVDGLGKKTEAVALGLRGAVIVGL